jgi:glycosyltransferase involved in cell wall biosynthesis
MRLLLVTDAWEPQVNEVVSTLRRTCQELTSIGVTIERISPEQFITMPCPSYPEVRLALFAYSAIQKTLKQFAPDAVHIATEGPLGVAARAACLNSRMRFTTSYHTRFPEYVSARWPIPPAVSYGYMRWFHDAAAYTMVATPSLERELLARGFRRIRRWSRGVDTQVFRPQEAHASPRTEPVFIYLGRVSVEKNVEAFLTLSLPGKKIVVGDGPAKEVLQQRFPEVTFTGTLRGENLVSTLSAADVMVFPSRTDTFGLVILEAMACGVPVAAYPVTGPIDVIEHGETGWLSENLGDAAVKALSLSRAICRRTAEQKSWQMAAGQFLDNLVPSRKIVRTRVRRFARSRRPRVQHVNPAR